MAAVSYIGASNLIATNGAAPGAITAHVSTTVNDLLIWYHYGRGTGGNETISFPAGWNVLFNSVTANQGHVAVAWRIRQSGDGTYTSTVTNYTSGTTGETILQWIETFRNTSRSAPVDFTATLSTWASSLNLGPISAPTSATVRPDDMVVVFGGRFENITAQTVLTGDNLTWTNRTRNDTTQGTDAGAVTQTGLNATGVNQTVTAKTITTTGTAQTGAGRMFIIRALQEVTITETTTSTETNSSTKTLIASITETADGADTVNSSTTTLAPLTESTTLIDNTDASAGGITHNVIISESTISSENTSSTITIVTSISDNSAANDTNTTTKITVGQISDNTGIIDVSSSTSVANVSIVETNTIIETQNSTAFLGVNIHELTNSIDISRLIVKPTPNIGPFISISHDITPIVILV